MQNLVYNYKHRYEKLSAYHLSYKAKNDERVRHLQAELSKYQQIHWYIPVEVLNDDVENLDKELATTFNKTMLNLFIRRINLRKYIHVQAISQTIQDEKWIIFKDGAMSAYDWIVQYLGEFSKKEKWKFFDRITWEMKEKIEKSE